MKEIYRIIANTFRNGNHFDYVDWMNADTVVIDGTYDLEELASDMERYITSQRQDWLRSEIEKLEGMKTKSSCGCPPFKPQHDGYCWNEEFPGESRAHNQALTSIITRYKEELLELEKGV